MRLLINDITGTYMSNNEKINSLNEIFRAVCLPASIVVGEILEDKAKSWKRKNQLNVLEKTSDLLVSFDSHSLPAGNPRVISEALSSCGNNSNELMQELWAGLIASSFSGDPENDQNIIHINLLNQLSSFQAKLLEDILPNFKIYITEHGFIISQQLTFSLEEFLVICGGANLNEIDISLDYLRQIGLINGGIDLRSPIVQITLLPLFLTLHARCKGWFGEIYSFYNINPKEDILPPTKVEESIASIKKTTKKHKPNK